MSESATRARAVVVRSAGAAARLEDVVLDPPGPGEVRLRILATGVCHTDLHARLGNFGAEFPYYLGHEATGVVEELGPGVTAPRVGETVIVNWRAACGECRFCTAGRAAFCARPLVAAAGRMKTADGLTLGRVLGVGSFGTHTIVHARQCVPVAADLPPEATCLIGCGVVTGVGAVLYAAAVRAGATVAVFGCGAVGISVIQGALLAGASRIIAVDIAPRKLEWARQFGATDAVDAREGDPSKKIRELTGTGVDYAFEAIGLPETLNQALWSCDLGGTCVMIGVPVPGAKVSFPGTKFFYSRATLRATFYGDCLATRDFPLLAGWYRDGRLNLDDLVTARVGLGDAEVAGAFEAMERGEALRTVILVP